ncbi:MAG: protein-export membrane protein SecF [Chloroflexi bacterium RBG_16_72_14]|nr:MAG: protein-export membrane protein SecF [Chloroflexi bacterium RBG_16_72_14]
MFDLIGKRNWFFAFSLAIMIPGLIFIILGPITGGRVGLQFAIDFTGGTVWSIAFEDPDISPAEVKAVIAAQGLDSSVTKGGDGYFEIRTEEVGLLPPAPSPTPIPTAEPSASASPAASASASPAASASSAASPSASPSASASASPAASASASVAASASPSASASAAPSPSPTAAPSASPSGSVAPASPDASATPSPSPVPGGNLPTTGRLGEIRVVLEKELGPIASQRSLSTVGAVVSSDLITQALVLILVGSIGILLWITYRFRDVKMGVTALVALVHDVIVVVGAFAILGTLIGIQVDSLFVTAMLTVIGFSVHDTIVVFDRVRENRARHAGEPFDRIVNHSILQTFGRSITTSLTVVITLLALLLFAGEAIGTFVFALLLGIVSGTYSSIFNASPLLVVWHEWEDRKRARENAARPSRRATT